MVIGIWILLVTVVTGLVDILCHGSYLCLSNRVVQDTKKIEFPYIKFIVQGKERRKEKQRRKQIRNKINIENCKPGSVLSNVAHNAGIIQFIYL